ncbi:MAG: TIGR04086 family membrane protein [Actinomycetota bacterium]|nr:TIGR04086 family membrane protein [Actinomycetota bacterium]
MSDRPEDRPEERRRTGPLGDDGNAEETRRVPRQDADAGTTRRAPTGSSGQTGQSPSPETERIPQRSAREAEEKETRVIRTPGGPGGAAPGGTARQDAAPYPRGYFEAADEREDRLRDMYGGVDWLASFLGFIFALVAAAVFSLVAGLVLAPLGFSPNLGEAQIGAAVITGLVLVGILVFLTYFIGGYVAGRLARFDGGRNGAMLLLWSFLAVAVLALAGGILSSFLPAGIAGGIRNFIQNNVLATLGNLAELGGVGIIVAAGGLLLALLGGFLGGRLGSRYHSEIDRTT